MIHTTIGVYSDGSCKVNGVKSENLAEHLAYNINYRPGRALLLNGLILYKGFLGKNNLAKALAKHGHIKVKEDTAPYQ